MENLGATIGILARNWKNNFSTPSENKHMQLKNTGLVQMIFWFSDRLAVSFSVSDLPICPPARWRPTMAFNG